MQVKEGKKLYAMGKSIQNTTYTDKLKNEKHEHLESPIVI